jgi:hypothetical protein
VKALSGHLERSFRLMQPEARIHRQLHVEDCF